MGLGMHLEINRRYGGHGGHDTEWELVTRSMDVMARVAKLRSFEDERIVNAAVYKEHASFDILQDSGDDFAFYVFRWLTAWDEQPWVPPQKVEESVPVYKARTFDLEFLKDLMENNTNWHSGETTRVDDDYFEDYKVSGLDPEEDLTLPVYYQDITTDTMYADCPIRVFLNAKKEPVQAWVGWGGISDCWDAEHAADIIAEEIAANDDGFGLEPSCFHPAIRDSVWKALQGYCRPFVE